MVVLLQTSVLCKCLVCNSVVTNICVLSKRVLNLWLCRHKQVFCVSVCLVCISVVINMCVPSKRFLNL